MAFIDSIDTEAGAVMYHNCFPFKFDLLNSSEALGSSVMDWDRNPEGGIKGLGPSNDTTFGSVGLLL